jgi:hypothetical protein
VRAKYHQALHESIGPRNGRKTDEGTRYEVDGQKSVLWTFAARAPHARDRFVRRAAELVYSHEFRQGVTYCPASPPYDDWATFRAALPASGVTSITVSSTFDQVGRSCNDPLLAQQIADALRTGGGMPGEAAPPAFH